jgi:hypothetical protein
MRTSSPWGLTIPIQSNNRPDMVGRPHGTLFHDTGQTSWGRRRIITKPQGVSEHDFHHLHGKFADPEDAA